MNRYILIRDECKLRKLNVTDYLGNWFTNDIPDNCKKDYTPTLEERIKERILKSPKKTWHYYGHEINKDDAIKRLTNDFYYDNPDL